MGVVLERKKFAYEVFMKGKTAAGGGAICAIAVMITIVMGNGNVRTNQAGLELIETLKVADVTHTCARRVYGLTGLVIHTG